MGEPQTWFSEVLSNLTLVRCSSTTTAHVLRVREARSRSGLGRPLYGGGFMTDLLSAGDGGQWLSPAPQ